MRSQLKWRALIGYCPHSVQNDAANNYRAQTWDISAPIVASPSSTFGMCSLTYRVLDRKNEGRAAVLR